MLDYLLWYSINTVLFYMEHILKMLKVHTRTGTHPTQKNIKWEEAAGRSKLNGGGMSSLKKDKLDFESYHCSKIPETGTKEIRVSLLKRPFDLLLSLVGLVVSFPLWIVISAAIWLEDGKPIFYSQARLGKDGKDLRVLKFRSMIKNAEQQTGPVWANKEDYRITRVGKIIRRTALDELPQLLNILKGDMSFVGPRAERPEIANEVAKEILRFNSRLWVRPGLTGIAQVYGNYNTPPRNKLRYDVLYIKNQSFLLDLKLVLLSFWITFTFRWSEREKRFDRMIGQIILESGVITEGQLKEALEYQKIWGGKIGENLIRKGYISEPELRHFLNVQIVQNGKGNWIKNNQRIGTYRMIGQIMLESGVVTEAQLQEALEHQKVSGGKIGENLITKGYISELELINFLNLQDIESGRGSWMQDNKDGQSLDNTYTRNR